jgi:natural product biosynthesis luciferase-like monooxygenase protein
MATIGESVGQREAVLIGRGPLLPAAVDALRRADWVVRGVCTDDTDMAGFLTTALDVPTVSIGELHGLLGSGVDLLMSAGNHRLLSADELAQAGVAINFHDGPLPEFGGRNVPNWAIADGLESFAVTWHVMTADVDAGTILAREPVELHRGLSALDINRRCLEAATRSLPRALSELDQLPTGGLTSPALKPSRMTRSWDRLGRRSLLDPSDALSSQRAVLATSVGDRVNNEFGAARALLHTGEWVLVDSPQWPDVRVRQLDGRLFTPHRTDLPTDLLSLLGAITPAPQPVADLLDRHERELARSEPRWRSRLLRHDAMADQSVRSTESSTVEIPGTDSATAEAVAEATVQWLLERRSEAVVAIDSVGMLTRTELAPLLCAPTISVSKEMSRLDVRALIVSALTDGPFLRDLVARTPGAVPVQPTVLIRQDQDSLDPNRPRWTLTLDSSESDAEIAVSRIRGYLDHPERLGLTEAEVAIMAGVNATQRPMGRRHRVVQDIITSLSARGDSIVLDGPLGTVTGAELLDRSARLATTLRHRGVSVGDRVGITTPRGPDMVIAVLAVLRCGAAFVPIDPAYPQVRRDLVLTDAQLRCVIGEVGSSTTSVEVVSAQDLAATIDAEVLDGALGSKTDVAYMIYTSGSTGRPKGVEIEHRQLDNFALAMDGVLGVADTDPTQDRTSTDQASTGRRTWLAVTSLSFDISMLELLWTLSRGFTVILAPAGLIETQAAGLGGRTENLPSKENSGVSLFFFGNANVTGVAHENPSAHDPYRLVLEAAQMADSTGFDAVWTPERHFHNFGGAFPNPAVMGAAIAAVTKRLRIRAGSVVTPLHHPIRIVEDWALVDRLSAGRVDVSLATGWRRDDGVLGVNWSTVTTASEETNSTKSISSTNSIDSTKSDDEVERAVDLLRTLWRGTEVQFALSTGAGDVAISTLPAPVQPEFPLFLTTAGNPSSFVRAGRLGARLLTHQLGQTDRQLADNITRYRNAWVTAGHEGRGHVAVMAHTFVGGDLSPDSPEGQQLRAALRNYVEQSVDLIKAAPQAFPTLGGTPTTATTPVEFSAASTADLTDAVVERFVYQTGIFGPVDRAAARIEALMDLGADEVACLVDFGLDAATVLRGVAALGAITQQRVGALGQTAQSEAKNLPRGLVAGFIETYGVTHFQCTPSLMSVLLASQADRTALGSIECVLVGGEALPGAMATTLAELGTGLTVNMYGPTETTIWSLADVVTTSTAAAHAVAPIGGPIANTTIRIVNDQLLSTPLGVAGELLIGGDGVARGYFNRPELTAERFVVLDDHPGRWYRTGDLVQMASTGRVEFLGRIDQQVKIRGNRVELGEIEAAISSACGARSVAVVAVQSSGGTTGAAETSLAAFIGDVPRDMPAGLDVSKLRSRLLEMIPAVMIPSRFEVLPHLPLTPNGKIDRNTLTAIAAQARVPSEVPTLPAPSQPSAPRVATDTGIDDRELVAEAMSEALGHRISDDVGFFDAGGHSLAALHVIARLTEQTGLDIRVTDIFEFPTVNSLAAAISSRRSPNAAQEDPAPAARSRGELRRQMATRGRGS